MDQLEFENIVTKMKHRYEEGDLKKAVYIADKVDWTEVNDINLLLYVSMIYEDFLDFDMAKKIVEEAYSKAPIKSRLYYALTNIYIKAGDLKKARESYIDFCTVFPNDSRKIFLRYLFLKKKGASTVQKSRILEEYIEEEKDETALFELATVYEDMGEIKKMISTCEYIVKFFGLKIGGTGRKALELKMRYEHLTAEEEELLRNYKKANKEENVKTNIVYQNIKRPKLTVVSDKDEETKYEKIERIKREKITEEKLFNPDNETVIKPILQESKYSDEIRKEQEKMAFMKDEDDQQNSKKLVERVKKDSQGAFDKFRLKSLLDRSEEGEKEMRIEDLKQHMIIEAYSREEAFGIAQEELDMLHKALHTPSKKAKASAYNLNERGFRYYEEKLGDRDLIIESAGQLKYPVIDEIEEFIIRNGKKNIIVLVDIINNFDKLALERPSFIERFDIYSVLSEKKQENIDDAADIKRDFGAKEVNREVAHEINQEINREPVQSAREVTPIYVEKVNVEANEKIIDNKEKPWPENVNENNTRNVELQIEPKEEIKTDLHNEQKEVLKDEIKKPAPIIRKVKDMNVDDFVEYCKDYAKSIDCALPGKTVPALYECIENMVEKGEALTEKKAMDLIESAADKAEKPKLFYKPRYDKDGNLILLEEHFIEA